MYSLGLSGDSVGRICLPLQDLLQTRVLSLGGEDPLEEEVAAHSRILAWRIPWWAIVHRVAKSETRLSG